jgi:hypothetical protein
MSYDIFLSYSNLDRHIAEELEDELKAKGLTCFLAEKSLPGGTEWIPKLREAIKESDYILLLLTPRSIGRPWVNLEIGAAWMEGKTIIPLIQFVDIKELPDVIKYNQVKFIETEKQKLELFHELTSKERKNVQRIDISLPFLMDQISIARSKMEQVRFQPNLFIGCGGEGQSSQVCLPLILDLIL